jgi:hypothetical protein
MNRLHTPRLRDALAVDNRKLRALAAALTFGYEHSAPPEPHLKHASPRYAFCEAK